MFILQGNKLLPVPLIAERGFFKSYLVPKLCLGMSVCQALLDDSENLKHHSMNDEIIHSAFMISYFQCESEITVLYCQAELDLQAFPNRVWERDLNL
jgi:hypothetical protein